MLGVLGSDRCLRLLTRHIPVPQPDVSDSMPSSSRTSNLFPARWHCIALFGLGSLDDPLLTYVSAPLVTGPCNAPSPVVTAACSAENGTSPVSSDKRSTLVSLGTTDSSATPAGLLLASASPYLALLGTDGHLHVHSLALLLSRFARVSRSAFT
ncbi:unnamed protein product [Protopolystoma xenopodis]|uniref:Uncharacterized protein n=1 Tax=Protopolystoma xenopodis TaxID=117903 RepID=A0A3S5CI94_9PLAT|nr:unnamed protein product [Protopolystoma xenopodis]